jgi:hypothetical protein
VYPKSSESKEEPVFAYRGSYGKVKQVANALAEKLDKDTFTIDIVPHVNKFRNYPLRTSPYDIIFYLNNKGIDTNSKEAQKLIEATRNLSSIARHLIQSKDIAGKSYSWEDVIREDARQAFSTVGAQKHNRLKRLFSQIPSLVRNVEDQAVAAKYLDALMSYADSSDFENIMSNVIKPAMYFTILWNSPTYVAQNLSEGIWAYPEAVDLLGEGKGLLATVRPLNAQEKKDFAKANKEGYIPSYMPASELLKKSGPSKALAATDMGRASEKFSADTAFKIGLKIATELGIPKGRMGNGRLFFAARFVNKVKPIYEKANIPIGLMSKGMVNMGSKLGLFPFMRWSFDMFSKMYGSGKTGKFGKLTKFMVLSLMLAGLSSIPRKYKDKPLEWIEKNWGKAMKRFFENGLPGLFFDVSSEFMSPLSLFSWKKWLSGEGNALAIISDILTREKYYFDKYGLEGIPMVFGAGKGWKNYKRFAEHGYQRKYGKKLKTEFTPTPQEAILLMAGFMPQRLVKLFEDKRIKKEEARAKAKAKAKAKEKLRKLYERRRRQR